MGVYTFPENTDDPKYARRLAEEEAAGICSFCQEVNEGTAEILAQTHGWYLKRNVRGLKDEEGGQVEVALIIVSKRHITLASELTVGDFCQVGQLFAWATKEFNLDEGCGLLQRVGGVLSGKTMAHAHWHIVKPRMREDGTGVEYLFSLGLGVKGA